MSRCWLGVGGGDVHFGLPTHAEIFFSSCRGISHGGDGATEDEKPTCLGRGRGNLGSFTAPAEDREILRLTDMGARHFPLLCSSELFPQTVRTCIVLGDSFPPSPPPSFAESGIASKAHCLFPHFSFSSLFLSSPPSLNDGESVCACGASLTQHGLVWVLREEDR